MCRLSREEKRKMNAANIQHLIAMVVYMMVVIAIGVFFARRANKDAESYFLGGRSLGPWVTAFSAEASDMSGWLLMGLPGLAYWTGLARRGLDRDRSCRRYISEFSDRIETAAAIQREG